MERGNMMTKNEGLTMGLLVLCFIAFMATLDADLKIKRAEAMVEECKNEYY